MTDSDSIRINSKGRTAWDFLAVVLLLLTCVIIPYQVAFIHRVDLFGSLVVYLVDLFFIFDLVLNFRTTYRHEGSEVLDRHQITQHYLHSFFVFDLVVALPLDALLLPWQDFTLLGVSVVLLVRLLRVLRIVRLLVVFSRWASHSWTNSGILRIAKYACMILLLIHWIACTWFFTAFVGNFPLDSWVVLEKVFEASPLTQYVRALYWAVVTMTTVGYGDITPHRDVEYVLSIVVILIGASMYAFIIGNIASLMSNLDSAKGAFWGRVETVNQYLRSRHVSAELNENIRKYYDYVWARHRGLSEREMFADLPAPVRLEVLQELTSELIDKVPLFHYCSPALRNVLLLTLQPQIFTPGGYIVRAGEAGNEIYFISKGLVEIVSEDGARSHGNLKDGDYFGDLSVILGEKRTASVKALVYCDMFVMTKTDFNLIKSDYVEFREVLGKVSSERTDQTAALVLDGVIL